jgi:hypothetical protein
MSDPIALLVDGDNISSVQAAEIAEIAAQHGELRYRRAYLDVKCGADWWSAGPFRVMHSGSGKNAADILLALDALELFFEKGIRRFLIATSDGDFRHLVLRLREAGAWVFGLGGSQTPQALRDSLDGFFELTAKPQVMVKKPVVVAPSTAKTLGPSHSAVDQKLCDVISACNKDGKGATLAAVGSALHTTHKITAKSLGSGGLRGYISGRPHLFDLDPKGPSAKVRLRSATVLRVV